MAKFKFTANFALPRALPPKTFRKSKLMNIFAAVGLGRAAAHICQEK